MICQNCIHSEVCKHKTEAVYECEHFKEIILCKECKHLYCCSAIDRLFYCRHHLGMRGSINPIEEKPYCSYAEKKSEVTE